MNKQFPLPKKYTGIITKKEYLNSKIIEVSIKPNEEFDFYAGQFISLKVSDKAFRSYSIASSNKNKVVDLIAAVGHNGVGSNFLKNINVGEGVEFVGPSGRFVLPDNLADNLFFIATGTGIAPIFSMLDSLVDTNCNKHIKLYFGIRDTGEEFGLNKIVEYESKLLNFSYCVCYSRQVVKESLVCKGGRVTSYIDKNIDDLENTQVFICGNPHMVSDCIDILNNLGVPGENLFYEKFTVSTKPS